MQVQNARGAASPRKALLERFWPAIPKREPSTPSGRGHALPERVLGDVHDPIQVLGFLVLERPVPAPEATLAPVANLALRPHPDRCPCLNLIDDRCY
jgi:hypothetical protein